MPYTLDDLELAGSSRTPFEFSFPDGDTYLFTDPQDISWDILANHGITAELIAGCARYEELLAREEVTGRFIGALLVKWRQHFGMVTPGEPPASSPSSDGTAGPSTLTSPSAGSTSPSSGGPAAGGTSSTSSTTSRRTRPTAKHAPRTTSSSSAST